MKGGGNINSKEYWRKREDEALKHYQKQEAEYDKEIERIYKDQLDAVQKEIDAFYGRYADNEGITLTEAKKRVSKLDIEAYERKAARYVKDKDFSKKANEEMRLYNLTMKVNRLEMLKANIGLEMISGHDKLDKFMSRILKGRTEEELKRQAGILGRTVKNNAQLAHSIPNASFHNATFSDRVWMYQDLLKDELGSLLQSGMIQGKNPRALARELKKTFNTSTFNAERLMRTEMARVQTEAQKQSFQRNGFEEYEFIANSGCCDVCQGLNGKHFKVKDMMPGENAAPMHPHCRCSVAAYEDSDEYEAWLDYLDNGGSTEEWNKYGKAEWKNSGVVQPKAKQEIPKAEQDVFTSEFVPKQTIVEAEKFAGNITKGKFSIDSGLNKDVYNGFNEAMQNVYNRFGKKLDISGLGKVKAGDARYQDGAYDPLTKKITVHNSARSVQAARNEKNFKSGFIASGHFYGTYYHEIGHAVWYDLPQVARTAITDVFKREKHDAYLKWRDMGGTSSGMSQTEVFGKKLSRYAHTDEKEFFSESFSQIMSGRARSVSREVKQILDQYYSRAGNSPKPIVNSGNSSIIKLDQQFFAEKDMLKQESASLKRAIRNYNKQIVLHNDKISNPKKYCADWDSLDERRKTGLIKHWTKEIKTAQQSIDDRVQELKKRGDYDE